MDLDPDYVFIPLHPRHYMGIEHKDTKHYFKKWGLHDNISIQDFCFNEPFQSHNKYHFAEKFFKDDAVAGSLLVKEGDAWINKGIKAESIEVEPVPCTVRNMSFFDKLLDPENGIVHASGKICGRFDVDIDGFLVSDNLRGMILDQGCPEYELYSEKEREEFIFQLFEMLVLGGSLCQPEFEVKPYLDLTRKIYKELVRVCEEDGDLAVKTTVLEVVAKDSGGNAYFPANPERRQNHGFLLVNGMNRQLTTFLHQFGTFHW